MQMLVGAHASEPSLHTALAEAAAARGRRAIEALAAGLAVAQTVPDPDLVDVLAARAGAMGAAEQLIAAEGWSGAIVRDLELFVTRTQIAWPTAREMMTSLSGAEISAPRARGLLAIVAELVAVVEADAPADRPVRLFLASELEERDLVVAFAAAGLDDRPVPSASAWRAICRAEQLAALIGGGLARGYRDGMMIFGLTVSLKGPG